MLIKDYKKIYERLIAIYHFAHSQFDGYPSKAVYHVLDLTYAEMKNAYEQLTKEEKGEVTPFADEEPPPPPPIDKPKL